MKKIHSKFYLKVSTLSIIFLTLFTSANSQQVRTPDQIEDIATKISNQIGNEFLKQKKIDKKDLRLFYSHYADLFNNDEGSLYKNIEDDSINTKTTNSYVHAMVSKYIVLYDQYVKLTPEERSFSHIVDATIDPPWPAACNTGCVNTNFENGTLSGWMSCWSSNTSTSSFSYATPTCTGVMGAVTSASIYPTTGKNQVNLTSAVSGNDPVCGAFIPQLCPFGGKYSVEIGDYNTPNKGIGILEQAFTITPANCDFTYWYAVVIENPSGHTHNQQPFFNVYMYDQNGNPIPFCGNYSVTADSAKSQGNFKGFYYPASNDTCYCRPWTAVFVPLRKYIGQCVTIKIVTGDCSKGGHFGYAYFDAHCGSLGIITSAPAICGKPITLTGPTGGASYQWTGPGAGCIIGSSTAQTITVGCPGKYTVIVQSVIGATCADTLDTVIASSVGVPPTPIFKSDTVCAGTPTQFTNLSTGVNGTTVYKWSFGDPGSGTNDTISGVANPVHTYPTSGVYTATLTTLNSGCGGDTSFTVVVNGNATAGFKATTVCLNNPTVFTDTSTGAVSWTWNFGEPSSGAKNTSALQNPTHTYATAGTFIVTETAGSGSCSAVATGTVTVNPLPTASFTFSPACFGNTTTFTDASTIASGKDTAWSWNFGDPGSGAGNTSTLQNPTHVFSAAGTYNVILTVTSNFGCQSTITLPVVVSPVPAAAFVTNAVCFGKPTPFTDKSTVTGGTISTWNWAFGDGGTSTIQNPTHTYPAAGKYAVTLIVSTGGGCADTITDTALVNPAPVALFTANTVCQGYTTVFTDTSSIAAPGTIASYSWNFGDGTSSTAVSPTHVYTAASTYLVSLTVTSNSGCDSTYKLNVIVNPNPKPAFTATTPCQGAASVFSDLSTISSGTIVSWNWNFGDGNTSTIQNPSNTYAKAGTYMVDLVVTSNNGCVDSIKQPVIVNPNPVVFLSALDTAGCVPLCVNFKDGATISSGTITGFSWDFGDSTSSTQQNPTHCYTKVDTFSVTLTATSNFGCTTTWTRPKYIVTWPLPVANFVASPNPTPITYPTVCFYDRSGGNPVTWFWTIGDGLDSTATTQNTCHTYPDTGTFWTTLKITNQYGCVDSIKEPVTITPVWTFYVPNAFTPNNDGLNEGFAGKGTDLRAYEMWIFDRWGMLLYHCTDITQPWDGKIHTGPSSGIEAQEDTYVYLIEITDVFHNPHRYVGRVTLIR